MCIRDSLDCNGGHKITGRNIRYGKDFENFILQTNTFIYNVNASLGQYTIQNLEASTSYNISVQAVSADFRMSNYSDGNIITTLPLGMILQWCRVTHTVVSCEVSCD